MMMIMKKKKTYELMIKFNIFKNINYFYFIIKKT